MSMNNNIKSRAKRLQYLGNYYIITDTKETEKNYFEGLRDSLPKEIQRQLVIKVENVSSNKLLTKSIEEAKSSPQFREIWIVFDCDQRKDFDSIISEAKKNNIEVAWSNPCIEIWFHAYFGCMPTPIDSVQCCSNFEICYKNKTNINYDKADEYIYKILNKYGDEQKAIKIAEQKLKEKDECKKPSLKCPATTIHKLIKEIRGKII